MKTSLLAKNQAADRDRDRKYREELQAQVINDRKRREESRNKEQSNRYSTLRSFDLLRIK